MSAALEVTIDLETLDVPGSKKRLPVILSIGATVFDPTKIATVEDFVGDREKFQTAIESGKPFASYGMYYTPVSLAQSLQLGFTHSPSTLEWWSKQGYNLLAQSAAMMDKLIDTLKDFAAWFKQTKAKKVWANAPTFDLSILREAFDHLGLGDVDIYFRHERDVRTVIDFAEVNWIPSPEGFVKHHGLCDAIHEAMMIQQVYAKRAHWKLMESENAGLKLRIQELTAQLSSVENKHGVGCE